MNLTNQTEENMNKEERLQGNTIRSCTSSLACALNVVRVIQDRFLATEIKHNCNMRACQHSTQVYASKGRRIMRRKWRQQTKNNTTSDFHNQRLTEKKKRKQRKQRSRSHDEWSNLRIKMPCCIDARVWWRLARVSADVVKRRKEKSKQWGNTYQTRAQNLRAHRRFLALWRLTTITFCRPGSCFDRIATFAIWLFTSPSVLAVRLCSSWRVWRQTENLKRKCVWESVGEQGMVKEGEQTILQNSQLAEYTCWNMFFRARAILIDDEVSIRTCGEEKGEIKQEREEKPTTLPLVGQCDGQKKLPAF